MNYPKHCNATMVPFDIIPAWVEIEGDLAVEDSGHLVYTPSGWTDLIWDGQSTVGYGCNRCGHVVLNENMLAGFLEELRRDERGTA